MRSYGVVRMHPACGDITPNCAVQSSPSARPSALVMVPRHAAMPAPRHCVPSADSTLSHGRSLYSARAVCPRGGGGTEEGRVCHVICRKIDAGGDSVDHSLHPGRMCYVPTCLRGFRKVTLHALTAVRYEERSTKYVSGKLAVS